MSPFLLGVIAVLYLMVAAESVFTGQYFKGGIVLCYAVANVLLIFVSDT